MIVHAASDNDLHPPRFGGTQRAFGLYRGLARRHDVRVLCVVPRQSEGPREETVAGVAMSRRKTWATTIAWWLQRFGLAPLWSATLAHDAFAGRWRAALPGAPDVRAVELPFARTLEGERRALRVYLSHNVEADFFGGATPPLLAKGFWASHVRAHEANAVRTADAVVACTDDDAARFVALYGVPRERVIVISNGWDETAIGPPSSDERAAARAALGFGAGETVALFLGSDHAHNRAALASLVRDALPAWRGAGVTLLAAGTVTRLFDGPAPEGVRALPEVPDLRPVMHAADLGLNNVAFGGGSNVKVPTYLAAGLAVVTTPFGLRGFPGLERHVRIAAPAEFPAAVLERPRGWLARGEAMPPEVASLAWGELGERLGRELEARLAARREPARRSA